MKTYFSNIGNNIFSSSWSSYWTTHKLLEFTSRSSLDLLETFSSANRNAKILPSTGLIDATNYLTETIANFEAADGSGFIEVKFYFDGSNSLHILFSTNSVTSSTRYFRIAVLNKRVYLYAQSGATFNNIIASQVDLTSGWRTIRFFSTGVAYGCTYDGVPIAVAASGSGSDDGRWLNSSLLATSRVNVNIGANIALTSTYSALAFPISYVNYNDEHKWIITGEGNYCFDSIGTSHLHWVGASHHTYNLGGNQDLMDSGYSIWAKAGSADEFVPYKAGSPNDVSAYLATYANIGDYPGSVTGYNFAPAIVDFDYLDTGHASLRFLDKSNSTYHIATGSMSYYDAANTYRWRQDELAMPQIYSDTYKNVGYKGYWMIKGNVVDNLVQSLITLYVHDIDFISSKEWRLAQECLLSDIVVQAGGEPVYDLDNYLTWI